MNTLNFMSVRERGSRDHVRVFLAVQACRRRTLSTQKRFSGENHFQVENKGFYFSPVWDVFKTKNLSELEEELSCTCSFQQGRTLSHTSKLTDLTERTAQAVKASRWSQKTQRRRRSRSQAQTKKKREDEKMKHKRKPKTPQPRDPR